MTSRPGGALVGRDGGIQGSCNKLTIVIKKVTIGPWGREAKSRVKNCPNFVTSVMDDPSLTILRMWS
jgi:hypothetical protein